jgi:hypothetical protein
MAIKEMDLIDSTCCFVVSGHMRVVARYKSMYLSRYVNFAAVATQYSAATDVDV